MPDKIVKEDGKFKVKTPQGRVLGEHNYREAAVRQLANIRKTRENSNASKAPRY